MTYYWDFFGPDAPRTAEHFRRHLITFLQTAAIDGCDHGVLSLAEGHSAAWCAAPNDDACALIEQRLRPRRATERSPADVAAMTDAPTAGVAITDTATAPGQGGQGSQ
jgi:hypothetical protein